VAYESAKAGTNQRIEAEFARRPNQGGNGVRPEKPADPDLGPDATIQ
jgi:hypothetical protein